MKERPILFSAPMVRALLAGTKTQTRRIVKPQPVKSSGTHRGYPLALMANDWAWPHPRTSGATTISNRPNGPLGWEIHCPYGQPGDRLWVKESWRTGARLNAKSPKAIERACHDAGYTHGACCPVRYEADGSHTTWGDRDAADFGMWGKHRVSIHMPRWASRLTLEITGVRVERLQDTSEADAIAEGIQRADDFHENEMWKGYQEPGTRWFIPQQAYRDLWKSINGASSWDANPWVWVVEFKRIP